MMMKPNLRANLFMWFCIPARLFLAWLPQIMPRHLRKLGLIVSMMAAGTLYLAVTNGRMNALESGGKTWWAPFRFIHGSLLAAAAVMLFKNNGNASLPLAIDAIIGIAAFFTERLDLPK
jgi:hypothetical protein